MKTKLYEIKNTTKICNSCGGELMKILNLKNANAFYSCDICNAVVKAK